MRARSAMAWGAAALLMLACSRAAPPKPPPPPPPPPPAPVAVVVPPKCEALDEACVASGDRRATIHPSEWSFKVPAGWTYAQEADGAVAVAKGAMLAISTYEGAGRKQAPAREEAFARLRAKLSVKLAAGKKPPWGKKPDQVMAVGSLKIALYQIDGATHDASKGPLLVFLAPLSADRFLIGIGFVPDDDTSDADHAILETVESLAPPAPDGPPDAAAAMSTP